MFSCVGQIFSKGYKIHIHEFFLIQPFVYVQTRGEHNKTIIFMMELKDFLSQNVWGHVCLSVCQSLCLFPLSEFEIFLLNKILRNIN